MKANNLSISVPNRGCDMIGHCRNYCVSKMTGYSEKSNIDLMKKNYEKVKNFARMAQVSSVSITGKGEPTMNWSDTIELIEEFKEFPVELQTNGLRLLENLNTLRNSLMLLQRAGLDVLALSLDVLDDFEEFSPLFEKAKELNLITRVTLNVTKRLPSNLSTFIALCKENHIDQFSFRKATVPNFVGSSNQSKWIEKNFNKSYYEELVKGLNALTKAKDCIFLRTLPYGAKLYDIYGISVTYFDYCIQDSSSEDDLRSLIFQEDGHLNTNWNSEAGRIF